MRKQLRLQKLQSVRGGVQTLLREITLSKKLKESIESQLALEAATRLRLNSYKNELTQLLSVFEAVDRNILLPHIPALVPLVAKGLHLPLPAILCQQLWKIMSRAALQEFSTGKVILAVMEAVLLCSYSPHLPYLSHTTSSPPTSTISPTQPSSHPLPTSPTLPSPPSPPLPHYLIPTLHPLPHYHPYPPPSLSHYPHPTLHPPLSHYLPPPSPPLPTSPILPSSPPTSTAWFGIL